MRHWLDAFANSNDQSVSDPAGEALSSAACIITHYHWRFLSVVVWILFAITPHFLSWFSREVATNMFCLRSCGGRCNGSLWMLLTIKWQGSVDAGTSGRSPRCFAHFCNIWAGENWYVAVLVKSTCWFSSVVGVSLCALWLGDPQQWRI